jgi:predicted aldo/keto reductase-like oxidoreductase
MQVSILTLGGSHLGRPAEAVAQALIETALELGVRTFETAQLYQGGGSEERLGRFLTPKYRAHVQVFTKTMAEDAATARRHLDDSLRRLRTDYLDLWQLHDVRSPEQAERRVSRVLDVMLEAKAAGKVRHIGFTGHATRHAHARILELTDEFETCQMPINVADPSYESYILNILPRLTERNMGVLAMKTLGGDGFFGRRAGVAIIPDLLSVADALRFVWSLPVGTLVSGMSRLEHLRENAETARTFTPYTEAERAALIARVAPHAKTGEMEWYKFDH